MNRPAAVVCRPAVRIGRGGTTHCRGGEQGRLYVSYGDRDPGGAPFRAGGISNVENRCPVLDYYDVTSTP